MPAIETTARCALFACLLSACASVDAPGYSYDEIVIVNQTRSALRDVSISATGSGRVFSCASIAPRGICSNRFPPRPYRASPLRIAWAPANGAGRAETVELTLPANADPRVPLRGVLLIDPRGQIKAYLQQDAPGPHL